MRNWRLSWRNRESQAAERSIVPTAGGPGEEASSLFLPPGYRSRLGATAFDDAPAGFTYQPHVYELAGYLAERAGVQRVIDLGCGLGAKLAPFVGRYEVVAVDVAQNLARLDERLSGVIRVEADLEKGVPPLASEGADDAIVICADVVEHLVDPKPLLQGLGELARRAPFVLLSTPDRARARGPADTGPPANPAHVREWTLSELLALVRASRFPDPVLSGFTINTDHHWAKSTALVVAGRCVAVDRRTPSPRVAAVINAYNEVDVLPEVVRHLLAQGADVHVVDNWSTDGTFELLQDLSGGDGRITVERFPERPSGEYEWSRLLEHTADWALAAGYDWIIHHDADELRYGPWPGVTLSESIGFVDQLGFNALDFTVIDFRFLAERPEPGPPYEQALRFFEFGRRPGHFVQTKAWRQLPGVRVDLASSGGHDAAFPGKRVFPLKFLIKHYPLRSKTQAEQKVFRDRLPRTETERAERGWHIQYEQFRDREIQGWDRGSLLAWHDPMFHAEFLVERLSGIGISR